MKSGSESEVGLHELDAMLAAAMSVHLSSLTGTEMRLRFEPLGKQSDPNRRRVLVDADTGEALSLTKLWEMAAKKQFGI